MRIDFRDSFFLKKKRKKRKMKKANAKTKSILKNPLLRKCVIKRKYFCKFRYSFLFFKQSESHQKIFSYNFQKETHLKLNNNLYRLYNLSISEPPDLCINNIYPKVKLNAIIIFFFKGYHDLIRFRVDLATKFCF